MKISNLSIFPKSPYFEFKNTIRKGGKGQITFLNSNTKDIIGILSLTEVILLIFLKLRESSNKAFFLEGREYII